MFTGSCLCGTIAYEVTGELGGVTHCHCSICRKAHGAAFASYVNTLRSNFRFTRGEDSIAAYRHTPDATRTFCKICGATLQWCSEDRYPEWLSVALGTLDSPFQPKSQKHIHVDSKADWHHIADSYPRHGDGG